MKRKLIWLFLFSIFVINKSSLEAQGVLFSEYRLLLDGREIKTLQACNPTDDEQNYMLMVTNKSMDENGKVTEINDTILPAFSLKKNIRVYPKTIKLAPRECQEVQVQVRGGDKLDDGEYRSYLQFVPQTINDTNSESGGDDEDFKMNIVFRVSPALPLIFRKNTELKSVTIDSVSIVRRDDFSYYLKFIINKNGNQSIYGNIMVEHILPDSTDIVGEVKGQAVYAEMNKRNIKVAIINDQLNEVKGSEVSFKISYIDAENTYTKTVWADRVVNLQLPN